MAQRNTVFLTIGTKGGAIPNISRLPRGFMPGRRICPGPWHVPGEGYDEELLSACAWVSENQCLAKGRTGEIEFHTIDQAVKSGRVVEFSDFTWTSKLTNVRHTGTAYIPTEFLTEEGIKRLIVIPVNCLTWQWGWIELKAVREPNGQIRNADKLVSLAVRKSTLVHRSFA